MSPTSPPEPRPVGLLRSMSRNLIGRDGEPRLEGPPTRRREYSAQPGPHLNGANNLCVSSQIDGWRGGNFLNILTLITELLANICWPFRICRTVPGIHQPLTKLDGRGILTLEVSIYAVGNNLRYFFA